MKATRSVATRSAIDAQPLPRLNPPTPRQEKLLNLSDAKIAVKWLNAAKDANAIASYERVVAIWSGLADLRVLRSGFQPDPDKWEAARLEYEAQRAMVQAGKSGREVQFPGARIESDGTDGPAYKRLYRRTDRLHSAVNEALSRYAFRPRVTYLVGADIWRGGMVPDEKVRWFQIKIDRHTTISEADAVLALVRLDLTGEIGKVALCQMCHLRWYFRGKRNYHFCGKECRAAYYAKHPDYHKRKAETQKKYRRNQKLREKAESGH